MNKHLHRIVFNRVRGTLMAVAETVSSTQRGNNRSGERGVTGTFRLRPGAVSVAAVLGAFHLTPYAQIVADPNAGAHRPTVDQAANGTPVVQITAPSAAGVSRNQYQQFNTGPGGAILNNAQTLTQTQLAGYIAGNPNLTGAQARVILNEVTGNQASSLRGYLEVAGQRAQVVIANPNGLVCDGCGVINSDRFTLTTGTPMLGVGGSLDGFRVTGGSIQVQGNGLNATNLDQVDLIARSVQVNGKLWANNVTVIAGSNTVNYADLGVQVITSDANRPTVAIDVGNLGGLYAGKIRLIGTEAGVGVNSAGTIAAQSGDLNIDSAGRVTLAGTTNAAGALRVSSAQDVTNTGTLYGQQNVDMRAVGSATNTGTLAALGNVSVTGQQVQSSGTLAAGVDASGTAANAGKTLSTTATGSASLNGRNLATGDINVSGANVSLAGAQTNTSGNVTATATQGDIDHSHGNLQAGSAATFNATGSVRNDAGTVTTTLLTVTGGALSNRGGTLSQSGSSTTNVSVTGMFDNTGGKLETAALNTSVSAASTTNDEGTLGHSGNGTLSLKTGALSNRNGKLQTNGALDLHATTLGNQGGIISSVGAATVRADSSLDNTGGTLHTDSDLDLQAGSLTNRNGNVSATGQIDVNVKGALDNAVGRMESAGTHATINSGSLINDGGAVAHAGNGTLTLQTSALSNTDGKLQTNSALDLHATSATNHGGIISAVGQATIRADQALDNGSGTIRTNASLDLHAASLANQHGLVSAAGQSAANVMGMLDNTSGRMESGGTDATINAGSLVNDGGAVAHVGNGMLSVQTGALSNASGKLQTNGALDLHAVSLTNQAGVVSAVGSATARIDQALQNDSGTLQTNAGFDLRAGSISNQRGLVSAADQSAINVVGALNNSSGRLESAGADASISAASLINDGGTLAHVGNGTLSVNTGALSNVGGHLQINGSLSVQASTLGNQTGTVSASGPTTVNASQTLDNTDGTLRSGGALDLRAAAITNRNGLVSANGEATVNVSGTFDNSAGRLQAAGTNARIRAVALTNDGGTLVHAGNGTFTVRAGAFSNTSGKLQTNGALDLHAASLANRDGLLSAIGQATIGADGTLDNTGGKLSADSVQVSAGAALTNDGGLIDASHGATVSANALSNTGGTIQNFGTEALTVSATQTLSNTAAGRITGNGRVDIAAAAVDNNGGIASADSILNVQSGGMLTNHGGTLSAKNAIQAHATGAIDNSGGRIEANGAVATLDVTAASIDNTAGRMVNAGKGVTTIEGGAQILNSNAGNASGMGTLGGNGVVSVTARTLANTMGGQVLAGQSLGLNVDQSVNNTGGKLVGTTGLTLNQTGTTLDNTDGTINASGDIVLNVASLDNTRGQIGNSMRSGGSVQANMVGAFTNAGGRIASDSNLSLAAQTVRGTGRIVAGQDAAISLQGDYNNAAGNVIQGNRDLSLTTTGTLTNQGELLAVRNLSANAANINNTGHINADGTSLNASGAVTNSGRLEGNTVTTGSDTFANTGTVIGGSVTLSARQISNSGAAAIVAAADTLNLYARQGVFNTNGATLYSLGNMTIAADGARDASGRLLNKTQSIVNEGSTIEADQNLEVAALDVQNRRADVQFTTDPVSSTEVVKKKREQYWFCANGYGYAMARGCGAAYQTTSLTVSDSGPTTITTNIPGSFVPDSGWQTQDTVYAAVRSVDPVAKKLTFADGTSIYYESISQAPGSGGGTRYTITYYDGGYNPNVNINPLDERPLYRPWGDHAHVEYERHTTTTVTQDRLLSATPEARMLAGNNMLFADGMRLSNTYSTVAAGNVMQFGTATQTGGVGDGSTIGTTTISNVGRTFARTTTVSEWSLYRHDDDYNETSQLAQPTQVSTQINGELRGTVSAGTRLTGNIGSLTNTNVSATDSSVAGAGSTLGVNAGTSGPTSGTGASVGMVGGTGGTVGMSGGTGNAVGMNGGSAGNVNAGGVHFTVGTPANPLPNFTLPTNGLFHINPVPGPGYLIETDPRFTNRGIFISSDYMLGRLGIDPALTQKRLGDGFYEQKLVNDQITQLTGRRYLQGYASAEDEYRALMESGASVAKSFSLVPGMALTDTQMAALTQDIVWMVEQTVTLPNGATTKVLAPVVYLAQTRADDLKPSGALITADAIDLHTAGDLNNSGRIAGDTRVNLTADNVVNRGGTINSKGATVISATMDVVNASGTISGDAVGVAAGRDIRNVTLVDVDGARAQAGASTSTNSLIGQTGTIVSRGDLAMSAGRDVVVSGATLSAKGDASIAAGRDVTIDTAKASTTTGYYYDAQTHSNAQDTTHLTSSVATGGNLSIGSGRDTTLTAAQVKAGGDITAVSQGNLTVRNATDTSSMDYTNTRESNHVHTANRLDEATVGSNVSAGGNVTLAAVNAKAGGSARTDGGGNVSIVGSSITAGTARQDSAEKSSPTASTAPGRMIIQPVDPSSTRTKTAPAGGVTIVADHDVTIAEAREQHNAAKFDFDASKGLLSSKSTRSESTLNANLGVSSTVSGETVRVQAGNDLTVRGSNVVGTGDVKLAASHDVKITTSQNTTQSTSSSEQKESGFLGSNGMSVSVGTRSQSSDQQSSQVTNNGSMVGSLNGNLTIAAGNDAHVTGSVIHAGNDLAMAGKTVTIDSAYDTTADAERQRFRQAGVTVGITSPVISAIQTGRQMAEAAKHVDGDPRLMALAAATTGLAAKNAYDAVGGDPVKAATSVGINISLGASKSDSQSQMRSSTAMGSTVSAGGNVTIAASGAGKDSNINVVGSTISSGKNTLLAADGDVNLRAAQSTSSQHSTNSGASAGVGVSISVGSQSGIAFTANASGSRGNADGDSTTWTNSHVTAGDTLMIRSGGDTNVRGAVVYGQQVVASIGGNLNVESLQDTNHYDSKQQSAGVGVSVCVPPLCVGKSSVSGSISQNKLNSDYAAVGEQSGIRAGDGGFQIDVKGNTDLKGGVIASSDKAVLDGLNNLTTATLTHSNIQNEAHYSGSQIGISGGYSFGGGGDTDKSGIGKDQRGKADNVNPVPGTELPSSRSGFTAAPPIVLSASGDASSTTSSAISGGTITITDSAKQQQLTGKTAAETVAGINRDASNTGGALAPIFDKDKVQAGFEIAGQFVNQAGTFVGQRMQEVDAAKAAAQNPALSPEQRAQAQQQADKLAADWGPAGTYRQVLTALTVAAGGNVTGGMGQFAQNAAVAYLQQLSTNQVKQIADGLDSESARAALHAIVGCAGAAASSQNCGAGALGAVSSSLLGTLLGPTKDMSASDRQARENIVTSLVAGIAAIAGTNATTATNAGQIEAENNQVAMQAGPAPHPIPPTPGEPRKPFELPGFKGESAKKGDGIFGNPITEVDPTANLHTNPINTEQSSGLIITQFDVVKKALRDYILMMAGGNDNNRMPIPEKVTANNGLQVESNPKHTPGMPGSNVRAGTEPRNSLELFNNSIPGDRNKRYAIDSDGNINRFSTDGNGVYHWSGSTGDTRNPLELSPIPKEVKRDLGFKGR
ncbi:hemagglutinin repeat-containing protein [Ralstonia sp. ASV6]|uniref:hemagglutinin repeat-containing protein n=1 Tax=Ralstonia sp. ASV6 TaxID=2795124 RepID=UPI0018EB577E|nr:hemagglutinin repeat-containing protein [Ralstonia sp. ASV6]